MIVIARNQKKKLLISAILLKRMEPNFHTMAFTVSAGFGTSQVLPNWIIHCLCKLLHKRTFQYQSKKWHYTPEMCRTWYFSMRP